jgi:hypothetical protein
LKGMSKFIIVVLSAIFIYKFDEVAVMPALFKNLPFLFAFLLAVVVVVLELKALLKEWESL